MMDFLEMTDKSTGPFTADGLQRYVERLFPGAP